MTKSDDAKHSPAWGTWEELLLAFAVNRYGTKSWSSISSELRKRTSAPIHITPHLCEQKYGELKRRFNKYDFVMDDGTTTATTGAGAAIPFLEDLRELRVLELQKELQNYDLYISSLQSKVKKLTEASEKTGGEMNQESDLGHRRKEIESEKVVNESPELTDSGQSVNGSNGNLETGIEKSENGNEASPVDIGDEKPETAAVGREGNEQVRSEPDGEASESPESIAESKSEGKNSDVQSSVGKVGNDTVPRGSRNEDGREIDDTDSIPVRSLPLVLFLQKVQKVGSVVFQRWLDRQEKQRYKNIIRQHIDYETLQSRLKDGWYSDGNDKFFRDLLLLVTNTRIFFPKESPESAASLDLRNLILKEMISKKKQKSKPTKLPPKQPVDRPDSSLLKPDITSQIVLCRKRSSIIAKEQVGSQENLKKSRDSSPLITKLKGKSPESLESIPKKKKKLSQAEEKKESAAKILKRMKPSNDTLNVLKSSGGRGVKEQGSPGKRSVGRTPNRAAAPPSLVAVSGKRNWESVDSETLGSKQTKKRSKR